jgi:hypothetical protein
MRRFFIKRKGCFDEMLPSYFLEDLMLFSNRLKVEGISIFGNLKYFHRVKIASLLSSNEINFAESPLPL